MSKPKKIVITGPESTGKTTLTHALAERYNAVAVPEYARQYIDALERPYTRQDLINIAKEQLRWETTAAQRASSRYFCDTDLLTIKIWMEDKFHTTNHWLNVQLHQHLPDLYLLCDIDLPWDSDPQREDAHRRELLMDIYERELIKKNVRWEKITGAGASRTKNAIKAISKHFDLENQQNQ